MNADGIDVDAVFGDGDSPVTHPVQTYLREGLMSPRSAVSKLAGDAWIYQKSWWLVLLSTVCVLIITYVYESVLGLLGFRDSAEVMSNQMVSLATILLSPAAYLVQRFVLANIFGYGRGDDGFGNRPVCASTALTFGNSLFVTLLTYGGILAITFLFLVPSGESLPTFQFIEGIILVVNGSVLWIYNAVFLSQSLSVSVGKGLWLSFVAMLISLVAIALPALLVFQFGGQYFGFDAGLIFGG